MKQATVLLSRQALHPTRNSKWVEQVRHAVAHVMQNDLCLIVSVGVPTYELVLSVGAHTGVPLLVVIPEGSGYTEDSILNEFALDRYRTEFHVLGDDNDLEKETKFFSRDFHIVETADILYPISIRPGGNMEQLINKAEQGGKTIERQFQFGYKLNKNRIAYDMNGQELHPSLIALPDDYIYHWTRTTNSKWPNEKQHDFYKAILSSDTYPRSAFATLNNILLNKRIIGSCRHMPNGCHTVSFSGLHPTEAITLMKWRSRYREMSFEPYGIGIKRETAVAAGVEQVQYFDTTAKQQIESQERWRYQSIGAKTDWRAEKEFRALGDFHFRNMSDDNLIVITRWSDEAAELQRRFGVSTVSMLTQNSNSAL